ncbi:MAG: reverse transcriptase domain-containing protein [Bacteroidales bacterium]
MKRKGFFSEKIGTIYNFRDAYLEASRKKKRRPDIVKFDNDLEQNLHRLLDSFNDGTFKTSEYRYFTVSDPKERVISKLPFYDHVMHWAILNVIEDHIVRTFSKNTFSCIKGRGTHALVKRLKKELQQSHYLDTYYYLKIDITKFYPNVDHVILKRLLRRKIKDDKLLYIIDGIIDSVEGGKGLPIGTKIAQLFSTLTLSLFDHDIKICFDIGRNPVLYHYYLSRYIEGKIETAMNQEDMNALNYQELKRKFDRYIKRLDYYYRYADDIVILHADKTFLHIVIDWIGLYIARELKLLVKPNWEISTVASQGIDYVGYVFYHTHVRARKRNKVALCRQVAKLKKVGLSREQIEKKAASRLGFVGHSDSANLFRTLGMETKKRLGQKIRAKKSPFEGLTPDNKKKFEEILYDTRIAEEQREPEDDKIIELIDYIIDDSVIEKNQDGTPKKRLAIRYRWKSQEWYSYTGSSVLIEQALTDFSKEDLPAPTVIKILINKQSKKFYRFT